MPLDALLHLIYIQSTRRNCWKIETCASKNRCLLSRQILFLIYFIQCIIPLSITCCFLCLLPPSPAAFSVFSLSITCCFLCLHSLSIIYCYLSSLHHVLLSLLFSPHHLLLSYSSLFLHHLINSRPKSLKYNQWRCIHWRRVKAPCRTYSIVSLWGKAAPNLEMSCVGGGFKSKWFKH